MIKRELKKENRSDSKIFEEKCCNQKSLNYTLREKNKVQKSVKLKSNKTKQNDDNA